MDEPSKAAENPLNEAYSDDEAQRRFEKLVRTALNTPPKPMKDMPRKRPVVKRKAKMAESSG